MNFLQKIHIDLKSTSWTQSLHWSYSWTYDATRPWAGSWLWAVVRARSWSWSKSWEQSIN